MAFDLNSIGKTDPNRPPMVMIYGTPGVGKTTFAANAPKPVFLFTEDGAGNMELDAFPLVTKVQDVFEALETLFTQDHNFGTLVIDSLDHLEPMIWAQVCKDHNAKSIEEVMKGFGKGYIEALTHWRVLFEGLDALRNQKGMAIILVAHSQVKRFEAPDSDAYDRYIPKLQARAASLVMEKVDHVLFATQEVSTKREETKGGQTRTRGLTTGRRVLQTVEAPAWVAKNRWSLPATIPLDWNAFVPAGGSTETEG